MRAIQRKVQRNLFRIIKASIEKWYIRVRRRKKNPNRKIVARKIGAKNPDGKVRNFHS